MISNLPLAHRTGLPDEIAYLRSTHPKSQWQAHANYGELAAFWLHIHDSLRAHGAEVAQVAEDFREGRYDAMGFQRAFVPRLNQFLQHLNGHHQIEDQAYFPKFRALDRRMEAGFDLLAHDHEVIHERLIASAQAAQRMLDSLSRSADDQRGATNVYSGHAEQLLILLMQHLADEEDLVIPAMLEHGEHRLL